MRVSHAAWLIRLLPVWPYAAVLVLTGLFFLADGISPITDSSPERGRRICEEVLLCAAIAGACLGSSALERNRSLVRRLPASSRRVFLWMLLGSAILAAQLAVLAPRSLTGGALGTLTGTFLTGLHLAALAVLLARLPLPERTAAPVLVLAGWVLPAVIRGSDKDLLTNGFLAAIDASRYTDLAEGIPHSTRLLALIAPIMGLVLLGEAARGLGRDS